MSNDWDVDSYKTEHENDEHWELRRKFMLTHKDKFPEDELVCLAQVFTNVEFLGCRYPDQTMIRVAELAKGVVEKYREKRKDSLKRTFVSASDAASTKVKGQIHKAKECTPTKKIKKIEFTGGEKLSKNEDVIIMDNSKMEVEISSLKEGAPRIVGVTSCSNSDTEKIEGRAKAKETVTGPLGEFVLILDCNNNPGNTLHRSAAINKCVLRWDFEERDDGTKISKVYLNDQFVALGVGSTKKTSKQNAAATAIDKLRESYHGIMIKSNIFPETTVDSSLLGSTFEKISSTRLGEDNIGRKLLKLMGWEGGGLGSQGQGIEEPLSAVLKVGRRGFGRITSVSTATEFRNNARAYIRNWMNSGSFQDLVFSSEFSQEERKIMHQIASSFSLKSKSYGKKNNRHLVISKKLEPWEIVEELKRAGGIFGKYELLYPTKTS